MPHVWHAVQLHEQDGPSAWVIEARLLARQSIDEIAGVISVSQDIVSIYEQLFFDVTGRLDAKTYIAKQIGLTAAGTYENHHLAAVLKWFGYFGGPIVLDVVAPILLDLAPAVGTEPGFAAKTKLLAALLALPDDANPLRRLELLADLAKTTRVGRAYVESPLAGVSEQLVGQVAEILDDRVVEDAVETDSHTDDSITEAEIWEAA